jgi:outer membrane protein OmpA-like peptidoglycan-associated protein
MPLSFRLIVRRAGTLAAVAFATLLATNLGGCTDKLKAENTRLTEENTQLRASKDALEAEKQQLEQQNTQLQSQYQQLLGQVQAQPAPGNFDYTPPSGGGGGSTRARSGGGGGGGETTRLEVAGDVLFDSGSTTIKASGRRELDSVAATIKKNYPRNQIRVEGYTDSDPIRKSKFASNEALSLARARAVEDYLATKGISKSRMDAVGRGAARPRATKAASRRVEIVILGN